MEIHVGRVGRVINAEDGERFVKIVDDSANTGGYLILLSSRWDMSDGFDNWVESLEDARVYFSEAGWTIQWL